MPYNIELKRRLDVDAEPLSKRICLAENALSSPSFPASKKEEIILEWLLFQLQEGRDGLRSCLKSLKFCLEENFHNKMYTPSESSKVLEVLTILLRSEIKSNEENVLILEICSGFIENQSFKSHCQHLIMDYFTFSSLILQNILDNCKNSGNVNKMTYDPIGKRALLNLSNFIKNFGVKTALVQIFIESKLLNTVMNYVSLKEFSFKALNICQLVLFPHVSLPLYKDYLLALIKGKSISTLIDEKGLLLKNVITVMDLLIKYKPLKENDHTFLNNFILAFVHCCKSNENLVLLFNIVLIECFGFKKIGKGDIPNIQLDDNIKEEAFLTNIQSLSIFNVNLKATYSDVTKTNIKHKMTFIAFLQDATAAILNNDKLCSKNSLLIMMAAIELEPEIFHGNLFNIFLDKMLLSKADNQEIIEMYTSVLETLIMSQFKLSRGLEFITKILQAIEDKLALEEVDDSITYQDILPKNTCHFLGKLGSEMMSTKNIEFFNMLNTRLKIFCTERIGDNPSISVLVIGELICACLCSFLDQNKMADQAVPELALKKFLEIFNDLGTTLKIFSEKLMNISKLKSQFYRMVVPFLEVCTCFSQLRVLLHRYQPLCKEVPAELHSYISPDHWEAIHSKALKKKGNVSVVMVRLLQQVNMNINKEVAQSIFTFNKSNEEDIHWGLDRIHNGAVPNLNESDLNVCAKRIFSICFENEMKNNSASHEILKKECVLINRDLLSMVLHECVRNLWNIFICKNSLLSDFISLYKKHDHDIEKILQDKLIKLDDYIKVLKTTEFAKEDQVMPILNILAMTKIQYLPERFQFMAIFTLFVIKTSAKKNKAKMSKDCIAQVKSKCDEVLLEIFELCYKCPNILELFPLHFIFERKLLELSNERSNQFAFLMLNNTFQRLISKSCVYKFDEIVNYLKNNSVGSYNGEILNDSNFQISSILFVTLTNYRKVDLASEIKSLLSKNLTLLKNFICKTFESIAWKSVNEDLKEKQVKDSDAPGFDMNLSILNVVESFCIIINDLCAKQDSVKLKKLGKGFSIFSIVSLATISNPDSSDHHLNAAIKFMKALLKNKMHFPNHTLFSDQDTFFTGIWNSLIHYVQNNAVIHKCNNSKDKSVKNLKNVTSIFEMIDQKFLIQFLKRELIDSGSLLPEGTPTVAPTLEVSEQFHVAKIIWSCYLNLESSKKVEDSTSIMKQICSSFYLWLRKPIYGLTWEELLAKFDSGENTNTKESIRNIVSAHDLKIFSVYFDIITEYIEKTSNISNSLVDFIIQLPLLVVHDLDTCQVYQDVQALEVFSTAFKKCMKLVNSLIIYHPEIFSDRWSLFLRSYNKMLKCLCIRSHSDKISDKEDTEILVDLALRLERLTQAVVKEEMRFHLMAPLVVAEIITNYQNAPVCARIKVHIDNCIYSLMSIIDHHSRGFLTRNLPHTRILDESIKAYDTYHKYTGSF